MANPRKKNWEAYSRDRAYELLAWLRRQGVTGLHEPQADAIRIWMRSENYKGYQRACRDLRKVGK